MKNWLPRTLGLSLLVAAAFAPIMRAEALPPRVDASEACTTVVNCGGGKYCCNSCSAVTTCFYPD